MRWLNRIYAVFAWLIVAIGILHMIATFRVSAGTSLGKVWFLGSGLAIALVGALNLLHRAYGASCRGVLIVCRGPPDECIGSLAGNAQFRSALTLDSNRP
jgi:hypothetical protein